MDDDNEENNNTNNKRIIIIITIIINNNNYNYSHWPKQSTIKLGKISTDSKVPFSFRVQIILVKHTIHQYSTTYLSFLQLVFNFNNYIHT